MLGRIMKMFDDETLGQFLTSPMAPKNWLNADGRRCFWGVAANEQGNGDAALKMMLAPRWPRALTKRTSRMDGRWFDALCDRFGTERVASAIRSRALSILAQRRLSRTEADAPTHRDSVVGCASEGTVTQR